ncbi:MAG: TIGR00341 family protein [Planctomycetota bacterium]|nr:TIGR00341 family protein [Planctomycetota bacterium]MDA1212184.1 TIGR00341 family protein [Planctomycetota bacterium]
MPLRVIQIYVPAGSGTRADEILKEQEVLGRWHDEQADQNVLNLLVHVEETEPIMDRFEHEFSGVDGFHVVLFPVEAALPRKNKEDAEQIDDASSETTENNDKAKIAGRISREELYSQICEGIGVTRVFGAMTVISAIVAAVGLMRNDTPVIIGAMVIAPLLGPNVAMALATTLGDMNLLKRALLTNVVGVTSAFLLAVVIGMIFTINPEIPAIASRTNVGLGDLLLAICAGTAGTLAFTRGLSGPVIGVMVAVALMPPLITSGILLGAGYFIPSMNALLLTGTNVICVNLSGIAAFLAQGVRPRNWWEAKKAKSATRKAIFLWLTSLALLILVLWITGSGILSGAIGTVRFFKETP